MTSRAASWDAEYASGRYRDEPPVGFTAVLPLRLDRTPHAPPGHGQWSQWEAIWQRRRPA
jgi:hypothetical protein